MSKQFEVTGRKASADPNRLVSMPELAAAFDRKYNTVFSAMTNRDAPTPKVHHFGGYSLWAYADATEFLKKRGWTLAPRTKKS